MALKWKFWGFHAYLSPLKYERNLLRRCGFGGTQNTIEEIVMFWAGLSLGIMNRGKNENRICNNNHKISS